MYLLSSLDQHRAPRDPSKMDTALWALKYPSPLRQSTVHDVALWWHIVDAFTWIPKTTPCALEHTPTQRASWYTRPEGRDQELIPLCVFRTSPLHTVQHGTGRPCHRGTLGRACTGRPYRWSRHSHGCPRASIQGPKGKRAKGNAEAEQNAIHFWWSLFTGSNPNHDTPAWSLHPYVYFRP